MEVNILLQEFMLEQDATFIARLTAEWLKVKKTKRKHR